MVVKVYISRVSGNAEVKSRQQRVLSILDSKNVDYKVIDISAENSDEAKDFMRNNSISSGRTMTDPRPKYPLPPQLFNDNEYCGDYDMFDMANECGEMKAFLKLCEENVDSKLDEVSKAEIILQQNPCEES